MTREQYIKILEKELIRINKEIDMRIISGEKYARQASEHKLLLRKIHQHYHKNSFKDFFTKIFSNSKFQY